MRLAAFAVLSFLVLALHLRQTRASAPKGVGEPLTHRRDSPRGHLAIDAANLVRLVVVPRACIHVGQGPDPANQLETEAGVRPEAPLFQFFHDVHRQKDLDYIARLSGLRDLENLGGGPAGVARSRLALPEAVEDAVRVLDDGLPACFELAPSGVVGVLLDALPDQLEVGFQFGLLIASWATSPCLRRRLWWREQYTE
jgi:hypothetical protein